MKFCPKCKSTNIDIRHGFKGAPFVYVCENCGFESWSLPDVPK